MRGEHEIGSETPQMFVGSSPHARGTRDAHERRSANRGIIPACAGNTDTESSSMICLRDHPRMRGEHIVEEIVGSIPQGSSPHARGTLWYDPLSGNFWGIIPACAGNTRGVRRSLPCPRDHPRMRGEHQFALACLEWFRGSSPHARGTLWFNPAHQRPPGIIPACAGNTFPSSHAWRWHGDHPRMRGEHRRAPYCPIQVLGSSPHARGTQMAEHRQQWMAGIIPACAGNT